MDQVKNIGRIHFKLSMNNFSRQTNALDIWRRSEASLEYRDKKFLSRKFEMPF